MRRYGLVLAVVALLAPSLSNSQVQQANDMSGTRASTTDDAVEAGTDRPAPQTANQRRSLMGVVMDVLIASAEQQSARQHASRQPDRANGKATQAASPAMNPASPSDLATHEQVAVESKP
jgi:cell division septation protein DedD